MAIDNRFALPGADRGGASRNIRSEIVTGPVSDRATHFSHLEPDWSGNPYPIQDDLRQRCPIAHTERFGGGWLPTRYSDVAAIAYDTERFSSRAIIMGNFRAARDAAGWLAGRRPSPATRRSTPTRASCCPLAFHQDRGGAGRSRPLRALRHALIDTFEAGDVVDAAAEYAQHIPMRVIVEHARLWPADGPRFREFVESVLQGINLPPEERIARMERLFDYLLAQVHDHLENPREDLTSYLIDAEIFGQKLQADHVTGTMALLLIAGYRHDVERDRRVAVAPGEEPG